MTALVAIEQGDLQRKVSVSPAAVGVEGSSIYLYEGEKLTLEELIYAMMLESANDAATAIAIEVGGSVEGFAEMMNKKALSLGLRDTHFTNPHGLDDPEHYTTARELGIIAYEAMKNETFKSVVSTYKKTIPLNESDGVRLLINHNKMLKGYAGAVGIKTGYTKKSGRCLVSAAEKDGVNLIAVTLNAPDDWQDHARMLDFGFSLFESRVLCHDGEYSYTLPIVGGDKDYVTVKNIGETRITLPKSKGDLTCVTELASFAYAPISEGEKIGRLVFYSDGQRIATVPLYAAFGAERTVYKKSLMDKLTALFGN
jgi:D-alanyl-D-alanine carboxypeptidase